MSTVKKLIFVDDEEEFLNLLKIIFKKQVQNNEIVLYCFSDGPQCLQFLEKNNEHENVFLFSDINMPIMDGFQLLSHLQKNFNNIPVWMLSAYNSQEFIQKSLQLGAKGFLAKPLQLTKIMEIIKQEQAK